MNMQPAPAKPLRADARRNREKVVKAAVAAFAEHGLDAQMDDIARRADVGVGTLYRHFPTKDALVQAIVHTQMEENVKVGCRCRDEFSDPWEAFEAFIRAAGLKDKALSHVVGTQPPETFVGAAHDTGLIAIAGELLAAGQASGSIRADASVDDIPIVMCGLGAVLRSWDEQAGKRYIEIVLAGFRAAP